MFFLFFRDIDLVSIELEERHGISLNTLEEYDI